MSFAKYNYGITIDYRQQLIIDDNCSDPRRPSFPLLPRYPHKTCRSLKLPRKPSTENKENARQDGGDFLFGHNHNQEHALKLLADFRVGTTSLKSVHFDFVLKSISYHVSIAPYPNIYTDFSWRGTTNEVNFTFAFILSLTFYFFSGFSADPQFVQSSPAGARCQCLSSILYSFTVKWWTTNFE